MEKGSFKLMKKMNQQIILNLIQKKGAISRTKIAKETNLAPATVSNNVKSLINMGLVKEAKRGKSSGGRKPILLELNPEGAFVIGFEWGISTIKGVLLNLNNEIISFKEVFIDSYEIKQFIKKSIEMINFFKDEIENPDKVYGVGIGVHGLVNPKEGISRFAPHFGWKDVSINDKLSDKINLPLLIDNDVRMMALAEKWQGKDDFIFINTGPGIGAALVLKGNLRYGQDFSAGEFGHINIVENGPLCSCGDYGCLESLISLEKLVKKYYQTENNKVSIKSLQQKWENLILKAKNEDKTANHILEDAGKHLGTGIAGIINLLNPESIIIGGFFVKAKNIIFPILNERIEKKALQVPGKRINIVSTKFNNKSGAVGAGIKVLQEIFRLESRNEKLVQV